MPPDVQSPAELHRLMVLASLFCLLLVAGIGAIQIGTASRDPFMIVQAVLDPGKCPMPCLMGIRPGITSMEQAAQLLRTNPYIAPDSIQYLAAGEVAGAFTANWRNPSALLNNTSGSNSNQNIVVENTPNLDVVNTIIVQVNIPLGNFVPLFGPPPRTGLRHLPGPNVELFYIMEYPAMGMQYDTWVECKQGQAVPSLVGDTYVLQAPATFISQLAVSENLGWHGFTSRPFDQVAQQDQCPPGASPVNLWFARLFGS